MSKTSRKTEGLSYPSNPLAAIRGLQDLDSAANTGLAVEQDRGGEASEVASATGSERDSQRSSVTGSQRRRKVARVSGSVTDDTDPMRGAILELLARQYASDLAGGPFTVTTVKIPTEIWERLGWVASLTGQTKQEILAEALKEHFQKVSKGR